MTLARDMGTVTVTEAQARRLRAWAWAVPAGMAVCAAGFVGAVVTIPAFDEGGLIVSVVVLMIGATVASLGAMYGALPGRYQVERPADDVDPDHGGGTWTAPEPTPAPSGIGVQPGAGGPGNGVGPDPEWWPAFEPVLAGWLREGSPEETR